jgi:hypothetical protein
VNLTVFIMIVSIMFNFFVVYKMWDSDSISEFFGWVIGLGMSVSISFWLMGIFQ